MSDAEGDAPAKKPSRKEKLRLQKLQAQVFGDSSEEDEDDHGEEDGEEQEDEEDGGDEGEEGDAAGGEGDEAEREAAAAKPPGPLSFRDKMQLVARGKKADVTGGARAKRKASRSDAAVGKGVARKRGRTSTGGAADAAGEASPGPVAAPPRVAGDQEAGDEPDSEDDAEGQHTAADEAFIDDEGAAAEDSGDDEDGQEEEAAPAPQAVEARGKGDVDDDIEAMFKPSSSRRKAKDEAQRQELSAAAADLVARMQVAADQDSSAREEGRVALAKLRMLPEVEQQLRHVDLAPLALEHGLLSVLAAWLRPGEDGSLPNARLRVSLLGLCAHLPIDTRDSLGRDHLKRSGLGKVVMYYKLHDDTPAGRAAAAVLVDGWSRPIFELSAAYRDMDASQQEVTLRRGGDGQRGGAAQRLAQGDEALGEEGEGVLSPQDPGFRHHAAIPEPAALDYTVRPKSSVVPRQQNANKTGTGQSLLKSLKATHTRKANYAAHKVSVEGRGLVLTTD